jgi:hypothetical protein
LVSTFVPNIRRSTVAPAGDASPTSSSAMH